MVSLVGICNKSIVIGSITCISVLLSASYQLKITNRLTGGIKNIYLYSVKDITYREHIILLSLLLPTIILGISPNFILDILIDSYNLIYNV